MRSISSVHLYACCIEIHIFYKWINGSSAVVVLAGCYIGALLYGVVDPWVNTYLSCKTPKTPSEVW